MNLAGVWRRLFPPKPKGVRIRLRDGTTRPCRMVRGGRTDDGLALWYAAMRYVPPSQITGFEIRKLPGGTRVEMLVGQAPDDLIG